MIDVSTVTNRKYQLAMPVYGSFISALIIGVGAVVFGTDNIIYLVALSIFLINVLCSLEHRTSRLLATLLLLIAYLLMVATNNSNGANGDYRAYYNLFDHFKYGGTISNIAGYSTDYGYMLIMQAAAKLNITYNLFIATLAVISVILIYSTISKITNNFNLVLASYILSPFFYDVFQFRYFFAYSIVVYAMQYILFEHKKNYLKYVLLIIFASIFHKAILFFLLYSVLKFNIKVIIRFALFSSVVVTVINFITHKNIVDIVYTFIAFSKFENYLSGTIKYQLNPLNALMIAFMILFFIFVAKSVNNKNPSYTNRQILWVNLLSILVLPFLLVSLDFERFLRPIMLINFALIAANSKSVFGSKHKLILIILIVLLGVRQYLMSNVTGIILENNYILDYMNDIIR